MKKYNYYSRKGFTLSVLIIVVVILVIIGMALLALSVNEFNFSAREENRIQAYYIARSSAEAVVDYINADNTTLEVVDKLIEYNIDVPAEYLESPAYFESNHLGDINSGYKVWLSQLTDKEGQQKGVRPVVHSEATYRTSTRKLSAELDKINFFGSTINTWNYVVLPGSTGTYVYGDITLFDGADAEIHPNLVDDPSELEAYLGPGLDGEPGKVYTEEIGAESLFVGWVDRVLSKTDYDDLPDPVLLEDEYEYIYIDDPLDPEYDPGAEDLNCDFLITADDGDNPLVVNLGKVGSKKNDPVSKDLKINGGGTLWLFISEDNLTFNGGFEVVDDTRVVVFVLDNLTLDLQCGNGIFDAVIFAPFATVDLSANIEGIGSVFAEEVNVESGAVIKPTGVLPLYPEDFGFDSLGYKIVAWYDE